MGIRRRVVAAAAVTAIIASTFLTASASFHYMLVKEVFGGTADTPTAQFIELQMYAGGQGVVSGHHVLAYNSAGGVIGDWAFGANVANAVSQDTILIATADAQTAFGVAADLTMTAVLDPAGGKVCWDAIDCIGWGSYSGPQSMNGPGTPFNVATGLERGASMERKISGGTSSTNLDGGDDTNNSAADFAFATPTPKNNARVAGSITRTTGFSAAAFTVAEAAGQAAITVTRSATDAAETVDFTTSNGSATAGSDYTATSGTLSFAIAESSKTFDVPILTDAVTEHDETIRLALRTLSDGVYSLMQSTLTILGVNTLPSVPSSVAVTAPNTCGVLTVTWLAPSDDGGKPVTQYKVYRSTTSTGTYSVATTTAGTTFSDTSVGSQGTRYYKVSAVNSVGEGPQSSVVSRTSVKCPPGAPQNPEASLTGVGQITVTWDPPLVPNGLTGYNVYRGTASGGETFRAAVTTTTYVDTTCKAGTICYYVVRATNGSPIGAGAASAEVFMIGTSL
ncbi:MAG: fibronectin type III domain-containing protein [Actinomycetota bacterium]|nr:hypothetical protein [Actinomycetota bacterium]